MGKIIIIYCILSIGIIVLAQKLPSSSGDLLDVCMDSKYHKKQPGPESSLFNQCTPWKEHSCCTGNTTAGIHNTDLYGFNHNHCSSIKNMSEKCLNHFIQDHCFYECSPNVGPWIVKESRSWRKERYFGIPLCASDCDSWFEDCKDDYTCTDNWSKNFDWREVTCKGGKKCKANFCPKNAKCHTFKQVYTNAKNFCETVFDGAWKYTKNDPCMKIWFNGPNPNRKVSVMEANNLFSGGSNIYLNLKTFVLLMTVYSTLLISI